MALKKIGDLGEGGTALSEGHAANSDSLKAIILSLRSELDALYAKMDTDFGALNTTLAKFDTDFVAQNGAVTGSQLDVDYASTTTLSADFASTLPQSEP